MQYLYVLLIEFQWEDLVLFTDINEAVKSSIKYPDARVEIFKIADKGNNYLPTYAFLKKGKLDISNKLKEVELSQNLLKLI